MKKRKYIIPTIEVVNIATEISMLAGSQDPWADAKPHKPNPGNNIWDDEIENADNIQDVGSNWAGYQQDMSIW